MSSLLVKHCTGERHANHHRPACLPQIEALRRLEERDSVSRAELIRQAVAEYVVKHVEHTDAFGAWKGRKPKVDGVTYQQKLRDEWER